MSSRWTNARAADWLRHPGPNDTKYRRGVLGMRTGSSRYPGAAVLGALAAWRTGIGMVRYVPARDDEAPPHGLPAPAAAVLAVAPETVFGEPGERGCDAWVIGSGTDASTRSDAEREALVELLTGTAPVVVDAGALELAAEVCRAATAGGSAIAPTILTPHAGEFARLWRAAGLASLPDLWREQRPERAASELAARLGATVLLKGSVTLCATPDGSVLRHGPSTPWLSTAGTGDVLAGLLGALVAGNAERASAGPDALAELGATAALLHDSAARIAAHDPGTVGAGRPITATDVAEAIPAAVSRGLSNTPGE